MLHRLVALLFVGFLALPAAADLDTKIVDRAPGSAATVEVYMHGLGSAKEVPLGTIAKGTPVRVVGYKCASGAGIFAWPYLRIENEKTRGLVGARNTVLGEKMLPDDVKACRAWMESKGLTEWKR